MIDIIRLNHFGIRFDSGRDKAPEKTGGETCLVSTFIMLNKDEE